MGDIWNILVPVVVIGGIFLSVIAENKKKVAQSGMPSQKPTQRPFDFDDILKSLENMAKPEQKDAPVPAKKKPVAPAFVEGERAIKQQPTKVVTPPDTADYNKSSASEQETTIGDLRSAIIAHEILKRKF